MKQKRHTDRFHADQLHTSVSFRVPQQISSPQHHPRVRHLRRLATLIAVVAIGVATLIFLPNKSLLAATYTWIQASWSGGVSGTTALHPGDRSSWTYYSAKDANVTAGSTVSLTATTATIAETSSTDFTAGTVSSTSVVGSGSSAHLELSSTEGSGSAVVLTGLSGSQTSTKTSVYESVTNSTWYIATYSAKNQLVQYTGTGTSGTPTGSVDISANISTYLPPVFDSTNNVLWVAGVNGSNAVKILKIDPSSRTILATYTPGLTYSNFGAFTYDAALDVLWLAATVSGTNNLYKITTSGTISSTIALAALPLWKATSMYADSATASIYYVTGTGTLYKQPKDGSAGSTYTLGGSANQQLAYDSVSNAIWTVNSAASPNGQVSKVLLSNGSVSIYTSGFSAGTSGISFDSYHQQIIVTEYTGSGARKVQLSNGAVSLFSTMAGFTSSIIQFDGTNRVLWTNGGPLAISYATYASSGTFTSQILDLHATETFTTASWTSSVPASTTLTVKVRSSNSATMVGATAFSSCTAITSGAALSTGGCVTNTHRYLQYEVSFGTSNTALTPTLSDITLGYTAITSGTLTSSIYNTTDAANILSSVAWTSTGGGSVSVQLRTSPDGASWSSWLGPTGSGDYYTDATGGQAINVLHHDGTSDQYLQYRVTLTSTDGYSAPTLTGITTTYVVNATPEFEAAPTITQTAAGDVTIQYSIRDTDTVSGTNTPGYVTPSFEYSTNNGGSWAAITTGLSAGATANKVVEESAYRTYTATWHAKDQIDGTYTTTFKVRVRINDNEAANNTASSVSLGRTLDVKDPDLGSPSITVDESVTPAALTLSASDDSALDMCITLDATESNCAAYSTNATLALATDPDTAYVIYRDAYGNTASASAVTPETPTRLVIRDISNSTTDEYQMFLTWAATNVPALQFSQYRILHSTDGTNFSQLATITDRSVNYYFHKSLTANTEHWYRLVVVSTDGNVSARSTVIHGTANGQGGGTDTVAPTISAVSIGSITTQSAVISWDTDELSDSTIGYDIHPADFSTEVGVATMTDTDSGVGRHTVLVSHLEPNTTYYVRVRSTDPTGNESSDTHGGDGYVFTTLAGPSISNVTTTTIDNTSATIHWKTNINAPSTVRYSQTIPFTSPTTVTTADEVTTHDVVLNNLTRGTTYYYEVQSGVAVDPNGGQYFTFVTTDDSVSPVISDITVAPIMDRAAVLRWTTDEKASSRVSYGVSSESLDLASDLDEGLNISHAVTLSNLAPSTTYFYAVTSQDASGNSATSSQGSFQTTETLVTESEARSREEQARNTNDVVAPTLSDIAPSGTTLTQTTIRWKTDEAANSFVRFGVNEQSMIVIGNWEYGTSHAIVLPNLLPATTYEYTVISADEHGNISTSDTQHVVTAAGTAQQLESLLLQEANVLDRYGSGVQSPTLGGQPKVTATATSATISWSTDKDANGFVAVAQAGLYETTKKYLQIIGDPEKYAQEHSVTLSRLTPDTVYHFQVRSKTKVSDYSYSKDYTFRTSKKSFDIETYAVEQVDEETALFRWTTNENATSTITYSPYRNNIRSVEESKTITSSKKSLIHQLQLSSLTAGVKYYVEIISTSASGNRSSRVIDGFITTSTDIAPVISKIQIDSALSTGEKIKVQTIISWTTDKPSTSRVYWREGVGKTTEALTEGSPLDGAYTKKHVVVVTSFRPGAVYQLQVESADSNGLKSLSNMVTVLTPQQEQTVIQVILGAMNQAFGWAKKF